MKKESLFQSLFVDFKPRFGLILLLLGLPVLLWGGFYALRPYLYHAWCAVNPSPCTVDAVNSFDQIAFRFSSMRADFWSTVVQNSTAVVVFAFPWLWFRAAEKRNALFQESFFLLAVTLWNGVLLEVTRALVQRPRPIVFNAPLVEGANIHQYTSFYSGHTSFVALATLSLYFVAKRRFPGRDLRPFVSYYILATALCGALRIFGGRHFPTDVLCGFAIGTLQALIWNRVQVQFSKNPAAIV